MNLERIPSFHIAVPYLDRIEHRERLARTLTSLINQTAVNTGSANLVVTVASGSAGTGLEQWIAEQFPQVTMNDAPDSSMYEALARVFQESGADFFGWLGAGDSYESAAFSIVIENSPGNPGQEPYWITGLMQGRRADGAVVRSFLPYRYRRRFFETGLHGTALPTIQQESTFWDRALHHRIDFNAWARFQLAGDFFLWRTFSQVCEPVIVEAALGAFTWHGDNQSQDYASYQEEVRAITRPPKFWERKAASLERMAWALHPAIKTRIARSQIRRFDWPDGPWRS